MKKLLKYLTLTVALAGLTCAQTLDTDTLDLNKKLQKVDPSTNRLVDENALVWGGSPIIGEDGKYHLFYATWGNKMQDRLLNDKTFYGMRGWVKYSRIDHAISDSPHGPYKRTKTILKGTGDYSRWDTFQAHNPHIRKFNGKYYLYYIAQRPTHQGGEWMSHAGGMRIGVVVADSIADLTSGNFELPKKPLLSPDNKQTFHRVVNPSVELGHDGQYYMMFKTATNKGGGGMVHWIAKSKSPAGPFTVAGKVLDGGKYRAEDPYFWYDKERKRYYAIVKNFAKENSALGPQFKCLCLITSLDPTKHWKPAKNNLVSLREYTTTDGKKVTLSNLERPQLLFDKDGKMIGLFAAAAEKNPFSTHRSFNIHIPLK